MKDKSSSPAKLLQVCLSLTEISFSLGTEVTADALRSMTSSSKPLNSLPTRCTVVLVLPALDSPRDHWQHWRRSRVERFWRTPGSWLSLFNWTWVIFQWRPWSPADRMNRSSMGILIRSLSTPMSQLIPKLSKLPMNLRSSSMNDTSSLKLT